MNTDLLCPARVHGPRASPRCLQREPPSAPTQTEGAGSRVSFVEDVASGLGPHEGLWIVVVLIEVAVDGGLKVDDGAEDTAPQALSGES